MIWSTDPSKNVSKIPPKFHDKTVQSNILWLNLNKNQWNNFFFYNQHINKVTPHFTFMRRLKRQIPMHTNSIGCPKKLPLSAPVLYWLSHLARISSVKAKNERKTFIFTQLKISRCNQHFFTIFRRILRNWPRTCLLYSPRKEQKGGHYSHRV